MSYFDPACQPVARNLTFESTRCQVQTEEMAATQTRAKDKDPKALSGGEKSFSTICLLLALWESIGCPIRCLGTFTGLPSRPSRAVVSFDAHHLPLDEFDVFMDAVNRRISMKMMVSIGRNIFPRQHPS